MTIAVLLIGMGLAVSTNNIWVAAWTLAIVCAMLFLRQNWLHDHMHQGSEE